MDGACEVSIRECSEQPSFEEKTGEPQASPKAKLPLGILFSTLLFCGESVAAGILCFSYSHSDDRFWLAMTIFFMVCPSILVQLTLIFIHRDLTSDKPLILLMHLLQLGPVIR